MDKVEITLGTSIANTPVGAFLRAFDPENRRGVFKRVSTALRVLVVQKLLKNKTERRYNKTPASFTPPAKPLGYWGTAASSVDMKFTADSASVFVAAPGITRAFGDLHIHAKSKLLTIPARTAPEAYGRNARDLSEKLFFIKTKGGARMLATPTKATTGGKPYISRPHRVKPDRVRRPGRPRMDTKQGFRPVYWLRSSVTVPQDRTILPSNAAIKDTAAREIEIAVRDFVHGRS